MLVVALAYFGAAKLGLALAFATPSVTAIWPPTGIALAALVLGGRRLWPGVALGAFLANVTTEVPLYTAIGITIGNTLEGVVGAYLLARFRFRPDLRRLRDIFALVTLAGLISTLVGATIGIASLSLGDSISGNALSTWRVWWLGDMGGDVLVAAFIFVVVTHWPYRDVPGRPAEALALLGGLIAVGVVAFDHLTGTAYLTFPFMVWAAIRFLQPGAGTAAVVVGILVVAFTANGAGQFVRPSEDDSLLLAQTFAAVSGLSGLILATVTSQRRQAEARARRLSRAFQTELLPPSLPELPQIETAAWYRPGLQEQEVGGDFYDVFEAAPGQWFAVIGDACGKGPEAASLTALARYTLRAVARRRVAPSDALRALNDAILEQRSDQRFMTVALAHVVAEGDGHAVTVSVGGHPLPLLVRADGDVTEVGTAGTLLGLYSDPRLTDQRVAIQPGDALVLFTDGLNETRYLDDDPMSRISEELRQAAGGSAQEIIRRLERLATEDRGVADDVALLVLSHGPHGRAVSSDELIALDLAPVPESAAAARAAVGALESRLGMDLYADLRLLVTELVTNSVRHADLSPEGMIHLRVALSAGVLRVEVSDLGVGFERRSPRPRLDGTGGWGLYIAEQLANRWGVEREGERTKVWLERDVDSRA
jgi:integral membrane sensor domain MASE1/anti-sigma regulatory factor (Ser/Thr protein kinase)